MGKKEILSILSIRFIEITALLAGLASGEPTLSILSIRFSVTAVDAYATYECAFNSID